jgi:hypothetical protein
VVAALVDEAVAEVNRLYLSRGVDTGRLIGEYLLGRFFGGEVVLYHACVRRHLSFDALRNHADLRVSASFLWYSTAVAAQFRQLPPELAQALPMSHHRVLVHVHDPAQKVELARVAVDGGLSKRALEQRVRQLQRARPEQTRRGRPALPAFVKAFHQLGQVRDEAISERLTAADLRHLSRAELTRLLDAAEDALCALDETIDAVREVIANGSFDPDDAEWGDVAVGGAQR